VAAAVIGRCKMQQKGGNFCQNFPWRGQLLFLRGQALATGSEAKRRPDAFDSARVLTNLSQKVIFFHRLPPSYRLRIPIPNWLEKRFVKE